MTIKDNLKMLLVMEVFCLLTISLNILAILQDVITEGSRREEGRNESQEETI
jgi:hypothetical protein